MPRPAQSGAGRTVPRLRSPLVLLAAGRGSRLGFPKALVAVDGRPWVEHQLTRFAEAGGREACVVFGHAIDMHRRALPWLDDARRHAIPRSGLLIRVAVNPHPERGMRSSLDAGVRTLGLGTSGNASTCFVMPIDCSAQVFGQLDAPSDETIVPWCGGRSGHPVRLGAAALAALAQDDAPLDRVLAACGVQRLPVSDEAVLSNLNHPEDWERLSGAPPELYSSELHLPVRVTDDGDRVSTRPAER